MLYNTLDALYLSTSHVTRLMLSRLSRYLAISQTRSFYSKSDVPSIYKPRNESWLTPTMMLVGTIPFLTFALGRWQLKRLKWKINLIDELEEKLQLRPLSLPPKVKSAPVLAHMTLRDGIL